MSSNGAASVVHAANPWLRSTDLPLAMNSTLSMHKNTPFRGIPPRSKNDEPFHSQLLSIFGISPFADMLAGGDDPGLDFKQMNCRDLPSVQLSPSLAALRLFECMCLSLSQRRAPRRRRMNEICFCADPEEESVECNTSSSISSVQSSVPILDIARGETATELSEIKENYLPLALMERGKGDETSQRLSYVTCFM